jgi:aerobic carbon-monoxide dehydrogenase small subunit
MPFEVKLQVNGVQRREQVASHTLLVDFLREQLHLRGTHQACDTAQCGACTVLVGGKAIKSCNVLVAQVSGQDVCTIEGLSPADGPLHVMQQAFSRQHALQCGFCTPGFVMRAVALAAELGDASQPPNADAVRQALGGNLCRCTGYEGIVRAVCEGISAMRAQALV